MIPSFGQIAEGLFNSIIALGLTAVMVDDFRQSYRRSKWTQARARLVSVSVASGERDVGVGEESDYQICYWVQAVYESIENSAIRAVRDFSYSQDRAEEEACAQNMQLESETVFYFDPDCPESTAFTRPSPIVRWRNAFIFLLPILWFAFGALLLFTGKAAANLGE